MAIIYSCRLATVPNPAVKRDAPKAARPLPLRLAPMRADILIALAAWASFAKAENPCLAVGEPIQWVADYCMMKMETDDEIAVSGCIEEERKTHFPNACASNTHFKERMCEQMIRNGTKAGTLDQCVKDPAFKGRTVEAGGVGA